jgi:serine-type D-Ala-D-Ala carboxypeptidase/endopeptidase
MPFRPRTLSLPALLAFLLCLSCLNSSAQSRSSRLASPEEIHDMLLERIDRQHRSVGIVVGVITRKAREVISYGHFDAADTRVPDADTLFEIGSISKVFTSLLLSDMVLKGEVKLSDPISKYLPASIHAPERNGKPITLLDLATHHSGLPSVAGNFTWNYSPALMYDFLNHYELQRDPGEKYEYSNYAVALLGQLLASRAGTDYETLLRTRITAPLQMEHTAIHLTPELQAKFTPGHFQMPLRRAAPWEIPALVPAGGIRSTVNDLMIFLAANMGILKTPLEPAMKRMLSVRRNAGPGVKIALGWHIADGGKGVVFHNGQTNGYFSFLGYDPRRKVGLVVLSNSSQIIEDIAWKILDYPVNSVLEEQHVGPPNLMP